MSSAAIRSRVSPEEYLAQERKAASKSEYCDGCTFAREGASAEQNRLVGDLLSALNVRTAGSSCEVFGLDMRVLVSATGPFTYPDIVGVCGELRRLDDEADTVLNPSLIVEVLSPSTASCDRGKKFSHYRHLPSLQEYVLVSQDRVSIEVFSRQGDQWLLSTCDRREATLALASLGCEVPLAEIYRRVPVPDGNMLAPDATSGRSAH